jgi:hypothetical protein
MRVPSLGVALTLPLHTCVLRAQSTNASLTGWGTDLSACGVEGWSSCSDKRRGQWNQKLFRQKCGPRTTPSWLGVGSMQFKSIRESKH